MFKKMRTLPLLLSECVMVEGPSNVQRAGCLDLEKAFETTWLYSIIQDPHRISVRGRLPVFMLEYLRGPQIQVIIGTTLSNEFYPEEGIPTGGVLAMTCFGLKINELPTCIARDIFRALFVDDLAICFHGSYLHTIKRHLQQAVNSIPEWTTNNDFRAAYISLHPDSRFRGPYYDVGNTLLPMAESKKFLGLCLDLHISFKKHICVLKTQYKKALNHIQLVTHLKWGGDRRTSDAVPCHFSLQARLQLHCVWQSVEYQPTTTGQHSKLWILTGIRSVLHQPSLQPVHRGQRNTFGGSSVKPALLSENWYLHWHSNTSWPTWNWPNH